MRSVGPLVALVVLAPVASAARAQQAPAVGTEQPAVAAAILSAEFKVTPAETFGHVQFLASAELSGRASGSAEGRVASAYIAAEFSKLGLTPAGDDGTFWQAFERIELHAKTTAATDSAPQAPADAQPAFEQRKVTCRNVLAWFPGSDPQLAEQFLLVAAHYDHLGRRGDALFHGADDNASGVAGLLGIARALAQGSIKPRRSVLFAAFDAEERGLIGAETFARKPPRSLQQLVTMINLDMIGRGRLLDRKGLALGKRLVGIPDGPAVGVLGTAQSPELAQLARAVFAADNLPLFGPENFGALAAVIEKQAAGRSDHAPFERRRIPFLFFSTSEHDDYHQPTDTLDKVDRQTLWRIAASVYRTVLAIDARDERPTFVVKEPGKGAGGADVSGKK